MTTCRSYRLPEHAVCAFTTVVHARTGSGSMLLPNGATITFVGSHTPARVYSSVESLREDFGASVAGIPVEDVAAYIRAVAEPVVVHLVPAPETE